jgi:Glycosyltransferase family 87
MEVAQLPQLTASERWRLAAQRAGTHSLLIWPPLTLLWLIVVSIHTHALAFDFSHAYLPAAHAILHGRSPYPPATIAALSPRDAFVYPPLTALLVAPMTVLPVGPAEAVATVAGVAAVLGTLRVLGIRDWRCYAIVFLWVPTFSAIQTINVTLLLTLGLALVWRYRQRVAVVSAVAGTLIALKLFVWPLLVWLVLTRRYRAAAGSVVAGLLLVFVPWAAIGFAGLGGYPHLVSALTHVERNDGYTIAALLGGLVPWSVGEVVGAGAGLAVLAASSRLGVRDERKSFALTIAAILLLSPIVDMHYFLFLAVVLALFRPRFGRAWMVPVVLWVGPQVGNGATWQTAVVLAAVAGVVLTSVGRSGRPGDRRLGPSSAVVTT